MNTYTENNQKVVMLSCIPIFFGRTVYVVKFCVCLQKNSSHMDVYMYLCMYMYVCNNIFMFVCMHVRIYVCM